MMSTRGELRNQIQREREEKDGTKESIGIGHREEGRKKNQGERGVKDRKLSEAVPPKGTCMRPSSKRPCLRHTGLV